MRRPWLMRRAPQTAVILSRLQCVLRIGLRRAQWLMLTMRPKSRLLNSRKWIFMYAHLWTVCIVWFYPLRRDVQLAGEIRMAIAARACCRLPYRIRLLYSGLLMRNKQSQFLKSSINFKVLASVHLPPVIHISVTAFTAFTKTAWASLIPYPWNDELST